MAQFLRDAHLANIKITEDAISQLTEVFANRAKILFDAATSQGNEDKKPLLTFIIRFDGKGYRLFSLDDLIMHFRRAKSIERIIITIETLESLRSNRLIGEHLQVRFDKIDENTCYLSATSADSDWDDSSYSAVQELLEKYKTKNGWARSGWTTLMIQLLGIIVGFALSLWAAARISPHLAIENAFIITFFFALLIFSNTWGYISALILSRVHLLFPNVQFYRPDKDRLNWLMQALIGGIATAFMLYVFSLLFGFIGDFLSKLPK